MSKAIPSILGQAPRLALSVPLTSNNGQRKNSRLANMQCFDSSALDHPDINTTGARASSNNVRTHLLNPSSVYVVMMHFTILNSHLFQVYSFNRIHRYLARDTPPSRLINVCYS